MGIHNAYAEFYASHAKVSAELSNGEIHEIYLWLKAEGSYSHWLEKVDDYNSEIFEDYDIDEDTIQPFVTDEFEFVDEDKQSDLESNFADYEHLRVVRICQLLEEPEWKVDDNTIEGNEPYEN